MPEEIDGQGRSRRSATGSRLVVLRDRERSETWVFAADEVLGVHRLARGQVRSVSSSPGQPGGQLQPGDPLVGGPERQFSRRDNGSLPR